jgi:hypothetical protein
MGIAASLVAPHPEHVVTQVFDDEHRRLAPAHVRQSEAPRHCPLQITPMQGPASRASLGESIGASVRSGRPSVVAPSLASAVASAAASGGASGAASATRASPVSAPVSAGWPASPASPTVASPPSSLPGPLPAGVLEQAATARMTANPATLRAPPKRPPSKRNAGQHEFGIRISPMCNTVTRHGPRRHWDSARSLPGRRSAEALPPELVGWGVWPPTAPRNLRLGRRSLPLLDVGTRPASR